MVSEVRCIEAFMCRIWQGRTGMGFRLDWVSVSNRTIAELGRTGTLFTGTYRDDVGHVLQARTELDDAGLGPERVELLWVLYEKARAQDEEKRERPAAPLAEADAAPEEPPAGASVSRFISAIDA